MDHPFVTRRRTLESVKRALRLLSDVIALSQATPGDMAAIVERREPEIKGEAVRRSAMDNACGMALLVREATTACATLDVTVPEAVAALDSVWAQYVTGRGPTLDEAQRRAVEALAVDLRQRRDAEATVEADAGSSSPSDYSDSHTETSDEDEEDDEDDSEDEDEDEEEEAPPSPKPRRRRP